MNPLKRLAGQTAIYGLSSIVGRFLNYLLVPLYTRKFLEAEYGVVTEMYAYVAVLIVVLTYGMETAFFRFSETSGDRNRVFSTTLLSVAASSLIFLALAVVYATPVARLLGYLQNEEYVIWFALIIAADAVASIPFARLRQQGRPRLFAAVKLANIGLNIGLNLLLIIAVPWYFSEDLHFLSPLYDPRAGIGFIFIANLLASLITLGLLLPVMAGVRPRFDVALWKKMVRYALPLLVLGIAGVVNETIDRIMLKYLLPYTPEENLAQVGIYGACYKLSIIMTLFIQAFRYAAEPFYFAQESRKNAGTLYADVMRYFSIVCSFIFLVIMMYIDVFQHFIGESFRNGLHIVPILLIANIFLGYFYNLSIWYKLTGRTIYGAWLAASGAVMTLALNYLWIPAYGYEGSAWATLACYVFMAAASYVTGRRHYPVPYDLKRMLGYLALAVLLYLASTRLGISDASTKVVAGTMFIFVFATAVYWSEKRGKKAQGIARQAEQ